MASPGADIRCSRPRSRAARPALLQGALPVVCLWLTACGGGEAERTEAEDALGSPAAEAPVSPGPGRVIVRMTDDMTFEPEPAAARVGDTVIWVNDGSLPHTTTNTPGAAAVPEHEHLPDGARPWDSGLVQSREVFRHVFEEPGEYTYLCTIHETAGMVGRITVTEE